MILVCIISDFLKALTVIDFKELNSDFFVKHIILRNFFFFLLNELHLFFLIDKNMSFFITWQNQPLTLLF